MLTELRQCPSGLCQVLKDTIKYGIAYHHSGLTTDEREILERGYRTGVLLALVATSTLSTGINLPAKVVFFKTPMIANSLIDAARYKQMSGRAGRTGFDAKGDSIMICTQQQKDYVTVRLFSSSFL
jgi:DNA polymerase theta